MNTKNLAKVLIFAVFCFCMCGCSERQDIELIQQENLEFDAETKLEIDESFDVYHSFSLFCEAYMFCNMQDSKFALYERLGNREDGYFLLDSGDAIYDRYGIDFRKYDENTKVLILIDSESLCRWISLESKENESKIATFDASAPEIMFFDLNEWGDREKVDCLSFRTEENVLIREEKISEKESD